MQLPDNPSKSLARLNPELFGIGQNRTVKDPLPVQRERELHDQIERYCRARGFLYCHARMDAASTIAVGFPDFAIFMPNARTVFLECKRPGGKATAEQLAKLTHARRLGFVAEVVESLAGALEAVEAALK